MQLKILRIVLVLVSMLVFAPRLAQGADSSAVASTNASMVTNSLTTNAVVATNQAAANPLEPPHPTNAQNLRQRWYLIGLMAGLLIIAAVFRHRDKPAGPEVSR